MQREIDAEIEAKNVGAAMGIPLTVVLLLIQKAKANELDDARDVFAHARPVVAPAPAESVVYGDDDEADLDEDDEYDSDDDGEEVYDDDDDYDPDDEQDEDDSQGFQMTLS